MKNYIAVYWIVNILQLTTFFVLVILYTYMYTGSAIIMATHIL